MTTIANQVKDTILNKCPGTFSLYEGYGMAGGNYVRFPHGAQIQDKRNTKGRCIKAVYQYADDSKLIYSYSTKTENYTIKAE